MDKLITHTPSSSVLPSYIASSKSWPIWSSIDQANGATEFPFKYNGAYDTERVLILTGSAILYPDDGGEEINVNVGDEVWFHKGYACKWKIIEDMTKSYNYFDAEGEIVKLPEIACDDCGCDCEEDSYLCGDEDVCLDCYERGERDGGVKQKFGVDVKPAKKKRKITKK